MAHDVPANHSITVRKPRLDFTREIPRYYLDHNPIKTHIFNALNLLFPEGERFFVRSVHDHAKDIGDPTLLREIRAFAGQEGQHAHHHERFFEVLERQGYDLSPVMKPFVRLAASTRRWPRSLRLSITAGAEHYTASMAALLLEHDLTADCDPTLRDLMKWHALEEVEHKHVAYDVLITLYPRRYFLRAFGFLLATLAIFGFTALGLRMFLRQDKKMRNLTRKQWEAARSDMRQGKALAFRRAMRPKLTAYLAPGFHPSQQDDRPLLARFAPEIAQRVLATE